MLRIRNKFYIMKQSFNSNVIDIIRSIISYMYMRQIYSRSAAEDG